MPHYSGDSEVIKTLFSGRLAKELAEQEGRRRADLGSRIGVLSAQLGSRSAGSDVYIDLANCYAALGDHLAALDALRAGVAKLPYAGEIHYALLRRLQKCGLDAEALAAGERACQLVPDDFALRLEYHLYLPKLYDSEQDILAWHRRYAKGLEKCIAECDLRTREAALRAARGFGRFANFYLAYQGFDDLSLLRRYGEFVHRVMSAAYPQWSMLGKERRRRPKPCIGYVSAHFREHTVGKLFLGWLTDRHKDLYRTHCYYAGDLEHSVTGEYRRACDSFFQSRNLEILGAAIVCDQPDVLVFTDIGMDPVASQMAALRLAPVQCVTWGHPVTTALPTIDYFISGELMERPNAQEFYTETLITLPNLGINYPEPIIPRALLTKTRPDYGLPEDAIIYLCCQSLFKYLPQYDHLFAEIAAAVPNSQFVFLTPNKLRASQFLQRLEKAFAPVGLRAADFCSTLPEQNRFDYWNLNLLCDVFLDTVGWSGGKTSLDAVASGLPMVTLPRQLMRSRHTAAILRLLAVSDTIAKDEVDYVAIAVRLGGELSWRQEVAAKMNSGHRLLFSDHSSVRMLESFLSECLREAQP